MSSTLAVLLGSYLLDCFRHSRVQEERADFYDVRFRISVYNIDIDQRRDRWRTKERQVTCSWILVENGSGDPAFHVNCFLDKIFCVSPSCHGWRGIIKIFGLVVVVVVLITIVVVTI